MNWLRYSIFAIIGGTLIFILLYLQHPLFWKRPSWERLKRIKQSPHYKYFQFKNLSKTPLMTYSKISPRWNTWLNLIKKAKEGVRPPIIPHIQTNLHKLEKNLNAIIWLWHSAFFMQLDWKTFLVDPTLVTWSPIPFVNKAFPWADTYKPKDIPHIDYLLITHDHYDHLDYFTVKELRWKIGKVVCWLWIGAHFERWWFKNEDIIELDWEQEFKEWKLTLTVLPARHFSWRLLRPNNTLRCSFMIESPSSTIYLAGDWGYDTFYRKIWKQWDIDIAIVENWQYSKSWKYIHTLPQQLPQTIKELWAKRVIPAHNGKYALSTHLWKEPLEILSKEAEEYQFNLLTPQIWEIVDINNKKQVFQKWRENVD